LIKSIFQSIGVVFTLIFMVVLVMATMYLSYILGISVLVICLGIIVFYLINMLNTRH
jgi:hypothetical protein